MNLVSVIEAIKNYRKGTFVKVGWKSDLANASAKKQGIVVEKYSEATVRLGINYNNIKKVQLKKAEQAESGVETKSAIIWFKHSQDVPCLIEHLKDENKKYLQIFTGPKTKTKVQYFINGQEVTKQEVEDSGYALASKLQGSKEEIVTFNIPVENLRFIKGKQIFAN